MVNKHFLAAAFLGLSVHFSFQGLAQSKQHNSLDSLYIEETEKATGSKKVMHAEPLFIDLIRDLGARKGEKEWNLGMGLTDNKTYDQYTALIEYEFAPINRLGLEVELPFTFHYPTGQNRERPGNKLNSLKLAGQYTFLVNDQSNVSMAAGYIHEFELPAFREYKTSNSLAGHIYNPFLVIAKRWGQHFHTLLYTGPQMVQLKHDAEHYTRWQINSNLHYMIPGTRNFIGIEWNKSFTNGDFDLTIRPQMRVGLTDNLLVGIVTGIPISRENERFSSFMRLIYEPGHKKK